MTDAEQPESDLDDSFLRGVAASPAIAPGENVLPGTVIGGFRIAREIGRGGMGVVFKARDDKLDRDVAIKVLAPAFAHSEERRRRFLREAKSAARIVHPNIATVFEVGDSDGRLFIAMELVVGQSLRRKLEDGPLAPLEAARIVGAAARALVKAHSLGIVHRDIKPDNVMLTEDGLVKVLDFGLAKLRAREGDGLLASSAGEAEASATTLGTAEGRILGTPGYMSPEQSRGSDVDQRTDVFALGVLLYELVAGEQPFGGDTPLDKLASVTRDEPPTLEREPLLDTVIKKCLEKAPDDRYADCEIFADALDGLTFSANPARPRDDRSVSKVVGTGPRNATRKLGLVAALVAIGIAIFIGTRPDAAPELASSSTAETSATAAPSPTSSTAAVRPFEPRRLTSNSDDNRVMCAALSPDGRKFVYSDVSGTLVVEARDGSSESRMLPVSDNTLVDSCYWHPDGEHITLTERQKRSPSSLSVAPEGRMLMRSALDAEARSFGDGQQPQIAPNGRELAYLHDSAVHVRSLDSDTDEVIAQASPPDMIMHLVGWSPEGKRLAYMIESSGGNQDYQIISVDRRGRDRRVLQHDLGLFTGFGASASWLRTGQLVFASSAPAGATFSVEVRSLRIDEAGRASGPPETIARWLGSSATHFSGSNDGRIAMVKLSSQTDVWVAELSADGTAVHNGRRLTGDQDDNRTSSWSADGRSVLMTARRRDRWQLESQSLNAQQPTRIASSRDAWLTWPTPLDDGAQILFWRIESLSAPHPTATLVRRLLTGGSETTVLVSELGPLRPHGRPEPEPVVNFDCAENAPVCVLAEPKPEGALLSRFDPYSGERKPIANVPQVRFMAIAPNGKRIAAVDMTAKPWRAHIFDLASQTRQELNADCSVARLDWMPDGQALVGSCDHQELVRLELDGRTTPLWSQPGANIYDPVVSPAGTHIAAVHRAFAGNVWLLTPPGVAE
jgi:serine/threonine protein kinase